MALSISSESTPSSTDAPNWVDYYVKNRNDGGPIQALFNQTLQTVAQRTSEHLGNTNALTETIVGSASANMMIVPGAPGTMQVLHHRFGAFSGTGAFSLNFAQGNLEVCTIFKAIPSTDVVAQMGNENGRRSGGNIECPKLASMMAAADEEAFVALVAEENPILRDRPNHALIIPQFFFLIGGARSFSAKEVAMKTIALLRPRGGDTPEILEEKIAESDWGESLLAMLWASEKGFLDPVLLQDVPENPIMNFTIRQIKDKLGSGRVPATVSPERAGPDEATLAQMEMMAASSVNLVSILTKMQDGNEVDKNKKEAEKSILKAMGSTQRNLFMALCTEEMDVIPEMSVFMTNLTSCKTPQKAISLLQSEARDWEGTFSPGAMHKLLSNGFLSQEANRANPGGFTIFSFFPKTVEVHGKGTGNELLREYYARR